MHGSPPELNVLLMSSPLTLLQESRQSTGSSRPGLAVQPLYVYLVGIESEAAEVALSALGEQGERLILTSVLEVCF